MPTTTARAEPDSLRRVAEDNTLQDLAEIANRAQARTRRRAERIADHRPPGRRNAAGETTDQLPLAAPAAEGEPHRRPDGRRRIYEDLPDDYRPPAVKEIHIRRIHADHSTSDRTIAPPILGERE